MNVKLREVVEIKDFLWKLKNLSFCNCWIVVFLVFLLIYLINVVFSFAQKRCLMLT